MGSFQVDGVVAFQGQSLTSYELYPLEHKNPFEIEGVSL